MRTRSPNLYYFFRRNKYFFIGCLAGMFLSSIFMPVLEDCHRSSSSASEGFAIDQLQLLQSLQRWYGEVQQPQYQPVLVNASISPSDDTGTGSFAGVKPNQYGNDVPLVRDKKLKFYRPRFHHAELKIKSELLLAVLISDHSNGSPSVPPKERMMQYMNFTSEKLLREYNLDVYYFFCEGEDSTNFVVSYNDGRSRETIAVTPGARHIMMLQYLIGRGKLAEYSFLFLMTDRTLLSVDNLLDHLQQMTASDHVLSTENRAGIRSTLGKTDSALNGGLLLSSSVLSQCALEWSCLEATLNRSTNSSVYSSHAAFHLSAPSDIAPNSQAISQMITAYPVEFDSETYHMIHLLMAYWRIPRLRKDLSQIEISIERHSNSSTWPLGVFGYQKARTRYEITKWTYWNATHALMPNDIQVVRPLNGLEIAELKTIEKACQGLLKSNCFVSTVYRKFDAVRGLEYYVDVSIDSSRQKQLRRLQIVKPLNPIELMPDVPYVTENMRLALVLPVRGQSEVPLAIKFLNNYANVCLKKPGHATMLIIVLIYTRHLHMSDSIESALEFEKREFGRLKKVSLYIQSKFADSSVKIVFLDLIPPDPLPAPASSFGPPSPPLSAFPSELAYLDLIARSLTTSSTEPFLLLHCRSNMLFSVDFLNRVRLNTIAGRQIFLPIPFVEYRLRTTASNSLFQRVIRQSSTTTAADFISSLSALADKAKQGLYFDVRKENGYFDHTNHEFVAFYLADYLAARQLVEASFPLVRNHQSIVKYQDLYYNASSDLHHLFGSSLAHMRAVEPELRLFHSEIIESCEYFESNVYSLESCNHRRLVSLGPKQKLASIVMEFLKVKSRDEESNRKTP